MKFPKGRPILENTRLEFVNLDNVLSAAKRERAHRISGYVSIIYPDSEEIIFLQQGEPFNAARISQQGRKIIPISEVIERAKNATSGILSEYATDEMLLNLIISSITLQPIKSNVEIARLQPKVFMDKLRTTNFNGFLWVKSGVEESFIHFNDGEAANCYVAGSDQKLKGNDIINFLLKKPNATISIFDHIEEATITQATPAQVDMFCKIFAALLKGYAHPIGPALVLKTVMIAKSTAQKEFPFLVQFKIGSDLTISGMAVADPKVFTQGMARWFDLIYESFTTFLGKESEEIAKKVVKDYRFALKTLNFFNYTRIKL